MGERLPSFSINGPVVAMPTKLEGFEADVLVCLRPVLLFGDHERGRAVQLSSNVS
jgi:hypothetical protein